VDNNLHAEISGQLLFLGSSAQVSQNNLSGKIGLQYAPDATTHTYLTLTRGYKAP
jgi:outer membrane receptor protein involved in Fe transport